MDPTAIQPTVIQASVPSSFSPNAWSTAFGNLTSTIEGWFGQNGVQNSAQAVAASTLPGQPSTTAAASTISSVGSALLNPFEGAVALGSAIGAGVSTAANGVTASVASAWDSYTSVVKWIVVGLVAVAIIYVLAQLKVLEGVLP